MYFGDLERFHLFLQEHFGRTALEKLYQGGRAEGIRIHVIYYPDINVYQGRESLQMIKADNKKVWASQTFSYFLMRGEIVSSSTILNTIIK